LRATAFDPDMDVQLRNRQALETDLRAALAEGGLRMVYQPQVDRSGRTTGVEALLRWSHPVNGHVPPDVFVPLAEECGLILPLGEFVLRRVFAETAGWLGLRVAINISAVQMRSPGFAAVVTRLAAHYGIDPARYELELTETALLGDDPATAANVEALSRLGFTFALDDFGTGYSSLSILQRFAVDRIKIDRTFVSSLGGNRDAEALVDAMVKLAKALNLAVIAEGVETPVQMDRLIVCGCNEFQGHLIGMPVRSEAIVDAIDTHPAEVSEPKIPAAEPRRAVRGRG
jgi:EAL domain-containing protein (putative c-di-GMP-specific phosphodiesterase class I)